MMPHEPEHLTAADVRKLPGGTQVIWYGRERHGLHTTCDCTIVQSGNWKVLQYWTARGGWKIAPIKDVPNRYFTLKEDNG